MTRKSTVWVVCSFLICLAVLPASAADPPALQELLVRYRKLGLPLPPADAKLVRFETGTRRWYGPGKETPLYALGFLLRPETKEHPPLFLVGTEEYQPNYSKVKVDAVEPKAAVANEVECGWMHSTFGINIGLATALQCKARGWNELAEALWQKGIAERAGHFHGMFFQPKNLPAHTALAYVAWAHWGNELIKPKSDRAAISKRMKDLLDAEPKLVSVPNKALLRSVELALVPSTAKPDSPEGLIDALVELSWNPEERGNSKAPAYRRLAALGFVAVPALIEHLEDERLTRTVRQGFNNFPTYHLRVGEVVSDLLQRLAGDDLGKDWLRRQQGYSVEKAAAATWWEKSQKVGEEAYVLQHVLGNASSGWPNQQMLDIISQKYPMNLPAIYRKVLDQRPNIQGWPVAEAVAKSSLAREQKKELFLHALKNKSLDQRRWALTYLKDIDDKEFVKHLIATLESLPRTPQGQYWNCAEGGVVHLVLLTDNPRVWQTMTETAKRVDVGLRMEFLAGMDRLYLDDKLRKQRLDFLAAFLDDGTVRDQRADSFRFFGPYSGSEFPSLSVQNMAAWTAASIMKMDSEPKADWSGEQWAKLREDVKQALNRKR